ncbi:hypothetical protein Scep_024174 [Stephania cephalantha]|uniref:Uncharacterized protein n=1 Tax=Stephania cephalantha TaxID=152367 RepID=A0AAP0EWP9_9MAGN
MTITDEEQYWDCGSKYHFVVSCLWKGSCSKCPTDFRLMRRVTKDGSNKGRFL